MKKILDFLKSHQYIIIAILMVLLVLKSCSGCKQKSDMQFQELRYTQQIDSLKYINDSTRESYRLELMEKDRIADSLRFELLKSTEIIEVYKGDKQSMQQTTDKLIYTIQKVKSNDTISR